MSGLALPPRLIVPRVTRGFHLEPLRLLSEGVAGVDEIDQILKTLGGFAVGPFEHMDQLGNDADHTVSCELWERLGRPIRLAPHPLQADLVAQGRLGRKTGRGFYAYEREPPIPAVVVDRKSFDVPPGVYKAVRCFVDGATRESGSFTEQYVFARTLVTIINEAALVVGEEVVSESELDATMRQMTRLPRGPLEWAEQIGRHTCATLLRRLNERFEDGRFQAADWLTS